MGDPSAMQRSASDASMTLVDNDTLQQHVASGSGAGGTADVESFLRESDETNMCLKAELADAQERLQRSRAEAHGLRVRVAESQQECERARTAATATASSRIKVMIKINTETNVATTTTSMESSLSDSR